MKNNLTPAYLSNLVPSSVGNVHRYPLRNSQNIQTIFTRTDFYYKSFLPSVIRDFNALPVLTQNAGTVTAFKRLLNNDLPKVPGYFYTGDRKLQILHTRLRTHCSSLCSDLFDKNIINSPYCECGAIENSHHYFLVCSQYTHLRTEMLNSISQVCSPTMDVILQGNPTLTYESNAALFSVIRNYIRDTKRFYFS